MTVRLTEEEVQELAETHTGLAASEHDPANGYHHGCCRSCGEAMPCSTAKLLAERREREAKLAELEQLIAQRETALAHALEANTRSEAQWYGANQTLQKRVSDARGRAEEAEAKLARVAPLLDRWASEASTEDNPDLRYMLNACAAELREALADPPRTAGGTDRG